MRKSWQIVIVSVVLLAGSFSALEAQIPPPAPAAPAPAAPAQQIASLKDTFKDDFLIGTALDFRSEQEFSDQEMNLIKSQYNVITPENSMKPQSVHPAEERWTFETADRLVKFCQANSIQVIGHTLVWHAQTGNWFFQGENGQPPTKEKMLERLRTHILTEVGHFKGKIKGWDVVNEAINDRPGEGENLRPSNWLRTVGPEFLTAAFKYAHEADPNAELHYNDYSIERGPKHEASMKLLKRLLDEGAPVTAVGIQGHWSLNYLPFDELDKAIDDYKSLGLKVMITELDITLAGTGGGQLTQGPATAPGAATRPTTQARRGGFQVRTAPATPEELKAQAEAYAKFFQIFLKHKDTVTRVTFWGLNDARSWRRGQMPLIFDQACAPKPSFFSILETARN